MRRDTGYLKRNGYRVYYKKKELRSDSIDWSKFSANKIPFRIVQDPSSDNSLGQIKFIFRNPFHIYLHDTPLKSKFRLSSRAVSHGCVRLERPIQFLEFVSQGITKYEYDDLRVMMSYQPVSEEYLKDWNPMDTTAKVQPTDETTTVFLQKPIPIYFTYRTIWVDENQSIQRRFDVYRKNKLIIDALNQS
jgi:murein L,D-transpeptidase YcbB/YkuD